MRMRLTCSLLILNGILAGCSSSEHSEIVHQSAAQVMIPVTSATELYVLGDMDDWRPSKQYQMVQISPKLFQVNVRFAQPGTTYRFKFADANWTPEFNFGGLTGNSTVKLNKPLRVKERSCLDELTFTPQAVGQYAFTLDLRNKSQPIAQVTQVE